MKINYKASSSGILLLIGFRNYSAHESRKRKIEPQRHKGSAKQKLLGRSGKPLLGFAPASETTSQYHFCALCAE